MRWREFSIGKKIFAVLGFAAIGIALSSFLLMALHKVITGHGLDTYRNAQMAEFNYIGGLITGVLVIAVLGLGAVLWVAHALRKNRRN